MDGVCGGVWWSFGRSVVEFGRSVGMEVWRYGVWGMKTITRELVTGDDGE